MAVVTVLPDGRIISRIAIANQYIASGSGNIAVTMTDLRKVEFVLQVSPISNVATSVSLIGAGVNANVVGLTINVGANTTITGGDVIAIGF